MLRRYCCRGGCLVGQITRVQRNRFVPISPSSTQLVPFGMFLTIAYVELQEQAAISFCALQEFNVPLSGLISCAVCCSVYSKHVEIHRIGGSEMEWNASVGLRGSWNKQCTLVA